MKQMIQIRCKNNKKTLKVATGSTLSDIFSQLDVHHSYAGQNNSRITRWNEWKNSEIQAIVSHHRLLRLTQIQIEISNKSYFNLCNLW